MLLGEPNLAPYPGYDSSLDPAIDLMFNSVTLRYGHTQVNNVTWRLNSDGTHATGGDILLRNVFFDPTILYTDGCTPIYRGLNAKQHNSPEVNIVDDLKENLFAKAGQFGLDLLSTNLRRARAMGLPNFGTARQIYGLEPPYQTWDNFTEWGVQLTNAYNTSDPTICDPWICGILETQNSTGGELGILFHEIFRRQFERFRAADRFWYRNNWFDQNDMTDILNTTLSMIILRNSQVGSLKCNLFEVPSGSYTGTTGPTCTGPVTTTGTTGTTGKKSDAAEAPVSMILLALMSVLLSLLL